MKRVFISIGIALGLIMLVVLLSFQLINSSTKSLNTDDSAVVSAKVQEGNDDTDNETKTFGQAIADNEKAAKIIVEDIH